MEYSKLNLDKTDIKHQISALELAKKQIEKKLGITYEEYEKLDTDKQHELIEKINGKKLTPDYRFYIDGIPLDENHVITRNQIDEKINNLTESKPKVLLKKISKPFKKR